MKSVELSNSIELSVLKSLYNEKSQMRLTGTDTDRVESLLEDFKARQNADVELLENPLNVWLITNESDDVVSIAIRDGNHRYKALVELFSMGVLKNTNIPINVQKTVTEFNGFNAVENFATNNALSWSEFDRANVAYRLSMGIDKNYAECEVTEQFPKTVKLEVKDGKTVITGADLTLNFEAKKVLVFNEKEDSAVECPLELKNGKTTVKWTGLSKFYLSHKALPTHIQIWGVSQEELRYKSMDAIFKLVGFNSSQAAYTQTYLGRLDILYNFGTTELRSSESASEGVYKVLESIDYKSKLNTQLTRFNFLASLKGANKKEKTIIQSITKILTPFIYNSFLNLAGLRLNTKETPLFGKPLEVGGIVYNNVFKLAYLALYARANNIESGTFAEIEATIRTAEASRLAEVKAAEAAEAAAALKAAAEADQARISEIEDLLKGKELSEVLSDEALKELHKEKQHLISKSSNPSKDGQGNGTKDSFEDEKVTDEKVTDEKVTDEKIDKDKFLKDFAMNAQFFIAKNSIKNEAFLSLILLAINDKPIPVTLANNPNFIKIMTALK